MNRPNMRKAIDAMCKECIYDGDRGFGSWREQVGSCASNKCPLYDLRPLPTNKKHDWQEELAIKYQEDVASGKREALCSPNLLNLKR